MNSEFLYDPDPDTLNDELTFREMLDVLIAGRTVIAAAMGAMFVLGLAYSFLATPVYEADGLLQVENKNSNLATLDVNGLFEGDTSINTEIEILRSRSVLGPVVDSLYLDIRAQPDYFPVIGKALDRRRDESERKRILIGAAEIPASLIESALTLIARPGNRYELVSPDGEKIFDGRTGEITSGQYRGEVVRLQVSELGASDGDEFTIVRQYRLPTIANLKNALDIRERGNGSGILEISLEGPDAESVSRQVNAIADSYVSQNKDKRIREAETTLEFLSTQLPTVKQEMEAAEAALNEYRLGKGSVDLPLETQAILETIVSVEGQRSELELERVNVTKQFTPAHPTVIAVDEQLDRLDKELEILNDQVRELPNTQQEVLRLVRDVAVNTELYTSLLNTAQELRVVKAGTVGNVRIVDTAVTPLKPVKPRKKLAVLVMLVLGGVIGVVLVYTKRALRGGVEDPDLIEQRIGLPIFATIKHSGRQNMAANGLSATQLLAIGNPNDAAIESIRNARTALAFNMQDAKNNCIMIAGPTKHVGKSFISANLATVLTSNEKRVLLIDGDMRDGNLHQYFGLSRDSGLSDFIRGDIPLPNAIHKTGVDRLSLIPTGKLPTDPTELLLNARFGEGIKELARSFDHVIIDTPEALSVTDAAIIGQLCGATVMVLQAGKHSLREIEMSVKRLDQVGIALSGLLINDPKP